MAPSIDPVEWASQRLAESGVENPRLEAQLLLALTLGISRAAVVAGIYPPLQDAVWEQFRERVEARHRRIPLAYIRGTQEFYGLEFEVGPDVLIPRPETELLVDFARERLKPAVAKGPRSPEGGSPLLADVGTGSGCIAIAVLAYCGHVRGVGFDLSFAALRTAGRNAQRHGLRERLRLVRSDLLTGTAERKFDLILSNPPYIPTDVITSLQSEVRDAEPRSALDGGPEGLDAYRRLIPQAFRCMASHAWLAVEIGQGQASAVAQIMADSRLREIEIRKDLAGIERLVAARRSA